MTAPSGIAVEALAFAAAIALPAVLLTWANGGWLPWIDEAQFVDPAARAHFDQGFTSTAWPYQASGEFFAGNAPGFSLLLVPWFELFGFGLRQARGLVQALALGAACFLWLAWRRSAPQVPAWLRGVALAAIFLGAGVSLSLWSARYDMLGLCVASGMWFALTLAPGRRRDAALFGAAVLLFYAGFHLVIAAAVAGAVLVAHDRARWTRPALLAAAGLAAGLVSWLLVLVAHGLVGKFFVMLLGSQHTLSGQLAQLVMQGDSGVYKKLAAPLQLVRQDPSLSMFALLLGVLLIRRPSAAGTTQWRALRRLAILFVVVLPVVLTVLGKFPIYYSWIAFAPAVLLSVDAANAWSQGGRRWAIAGVVTVALASSVVGAASRLQAAQLPPGSPLASRFDDWVRAGVAPGEWAYTGFEAYFAAREVAAAVIVPTYGQTTLVKGVPERDLVQVVVVPRGRVEAVTRLLGGRWHEEDAFAASAGTPVPAALDQVRLRRVPQAGGLSPRAP